MSGASDETRFGSGAAGRAALLCALLSLIGVAAGAEPGAGGAWEPYRSEAGRFAVDLPGVPVLSRASHRTLAGRIESAEYLLDAGPLELRVEHHDVPALAGFFVSDRGLLERAERDLVEGEEARTLEAADSRRGGFPAREVRYRLDPADGREGRALLVLVEGRLYVVAALHPPGAAAEPDLARFFGSLEVWMP